MQFIDRFQSLLKRHASIGGMQIEDINTIGPQLLERDVKLLR